MKTKTLSSIFLLAIFSIMLSTQQVHSEIDSPPSGSAGEPADNQTCARQDCHPGSSQPASLNQLLLLIGTGSTPTDTLNIANPTFKYQPNTAYNVSFLLSSFTGRYGFQIVALNSSNQRAGIFTVTDNINTQINSLGNRQYMGHKDANTYKNWQFSWTSPATSTGPITFYYAYNTANNDDEASGDSIYNGSVTILPDLSTAVKDLRKPLDLINTFPNPVNAELNIEYSLTESNQMITTSVYSLDGKLAGQPMKETSGTGLHRRSLNLSHLESGIYLLKLEAGASSSVRKFIKL